MAQDHAPTAGSAGSVRQDSPDSRSNDAVATPSAAQLIDAWDPRGRGTRHRRLAALLAGLAGTTGLDDDTLGDRNRRLLVLHRALVGSPLEARVACTNCGAESEFLLPADAILRLPRAAGDTRVTTRLGGRRYTFRLPRLADIEAAAEYAEVAEGGADGPAARDVLMAIVERCRVDRDGGQIPTLVARRLAARFEALDPAANVVVQLSCSGCGRPLAASADVAAFVARSLDRLIEGLLRDIDTIAGGYGWDERQILALPVWRRRRYVELIESVRRAGRPALAAASR